MTSPLKGPVAGRSQDTLLFLSLLVLVTTFVGYHFGFGNQTEALPIVERYRNPAFLRGDFFVDTGTSFGPRFYYAQLIAKLSRFAPVPHVMLGLTLATNAGVAVVSHRAARELLRADRLTGWLAATFSLCSSSFALGLVSDVRFIDFQPGSMAIPWALAGLWQALSGKPLRGALLSSVATIFHPLYGVETGLLALASAGVRVLLEAEPPFERRKLSRALLPTVGGGAVLGSAALLLWGLPSKANREPPLTLTEVVDILARFRAPHHYLPSTFPAPHYAIFLAFLLAFGVTFRQFWREERRRADLAYLVAPTGILLGCLLGYVFVELRPTQAMTTAQPFRLLYALKWQGFLLSGWLASRLWQSRSWSERSLSLTTLMAGAAAQPTNFLLAALHGALPSTAARERVAWALVLISAPLAYALGLRDELWRLGAAVALAWLLHEASASASRRTAAVGLAALILVAIGANHALHFSSARPLSAIISFEDHRGDDAEIARWARDNTPARALFVTPPGFGSFRLIAERAVVVDYKSVPFGASAMRAWYARMRGVYGSVSEGGFAGLKQMDENYARISDAELTRLGRAYGAAFAVLHARTATQRAVLHRNSSFQIVGL